MPITISDFRTNVRTMIRDTASLAATPNTALIIFQDPEIDAFIQSGVMTYSKYRPRRKPYTLSLQAGVSQYTLPSDWVTVDKEAFDRVVSPPQEINLSGFSSFVLPTLNNGPQLSETRFDWYDSDKFIIVNPSPQGKADLSIAYYCLHTVDTTQSTISSADFDNVVLAASSRALDALAVDRGMKMQKYKIGQGLAIDDTEVAKRLQEQAKTYWQRFEDNIRFRPFGVSG